MTWEDIIKLRVGPQKEEDAKRFKELNSPDKETRDKADREYMKELDKFNREIRDLATRFASLLREVALKSQMMLENQLNQPILH